MRTITIITAISLISTILTMKWNGIWSMIAYYNSLDLIPQYYIHGVLYWIMFYSNKPLLLLTVGLCVAWIVSWLIVDRQT